jgi:AcrR family transcriptional regulator
MDMTLFTSPPAPKRYDSVSMSEVAATVPTSHLTRSERVRRLVLDTAAQLIAEVGVERTSIDEVSARSGVAKSTIYRHFPSKQVLVVEAVHACTQLPVVSDTGSLRDDLISCFSGMTKASYEGRLGDMMLSLMDAAQRDPELGRLVRAQAEQRRRLVSGVLERAIARAQLAEDVDVDLLVTMISGPLVYTKLVRRQRVTEQLVADVVDAALTSIAAGAARRVTGSRR